ncbi:hypothetical protein ACFOEE_12685 [Pseudoalteromonas fenneropenaei]|uniref:Uncharacterized protein n=1 Tax=Pseudoalteromonas fenneropenaei TaxID=1737459 RepID=A0ABV7CLH3_9GAMM
MSALKRALLWLFMLILSFGLLWWATQLYWWLASAEPVAARGDDETRSKVHWLSPTKPLVYAFNPNRTQGIRVLSNAIFNGAVTITTPVNYAIEYALLDDKQQVLSRHVYHHASKLVDNTVAEQVKQLIENREALSVASGQSFFIDHAHLKTASALSLRLIPEEPLMRGVVVRLHAKVPTAEGDLERAWLKLPQARRDRLLAYHSLGANGVSEQELAQVVASTWLKLAPQGVPNIDFSADTLYEHLPYNVMTYDFGALQLDLDGFYSSAGLNASIRLREATTLKMKSTSPHSDLTLTWYDFAELQPPQNVPLTASNDGFYVTPKLKPGLLLIQSDAVRVSRWFLSDGTPVQAKHSYLYALTPERSAHFSVVSGADVALELRVPPNALIDSTAAISQAPLSVDIALYQDGQLIERSTIELNRTMSTTDRHIADDTNRYQVGEANRIYLQVPKSVNRIELSSNASVWAKLQARLGHGHYRQYRCEQNCQPEQYREIGAWFSQAADNDYDFIAANALFAVRLFEAAPEPQPTTTTYQSVPLDSAKRTVTALLPAPWKYFEAPPAATPYRFSRVTTPFDMNHPDMNHPELKLIASYNSPPYVQQWSGVQQPEQLSANLKNAKRVFINNQAAAPWLEQRLYFVARGDTLTLRYDKVPQSIVLKLFATRSNHTLLLQTALKGVRRDGIWSDYTIRNKDFFLAPWQSEGEQAFLLHPKTPTLYAYDSVTLPIGTDLSTLQQLELTVDSDVWIGISNEYYDAQRQVDWRQNELR